MFLLVSNIDVQCTAREVKITGPRPLLNYNGIQAADEHAQPAKFNITKFYQICIIIIQNCKILI